MATANGNNSNLKNQLQTRAANAPQGVSPEQTVNAYLKRMSPEIKRALPKHMDSDRLARVALTVIRTTPKLLECNIQSLMASVMQAAQLGLEPGLLGHCYIIPYGKEAQFQIGYRGMIDLARRSGNIQSISAREVYENDDFIIEYGLDDTLRHIPWHLRQDSSYEEPGELKGFYVVAKFKDGGHQIHYMSKHEIDQHRDRSQGYKSAKRYGKDSPWTTDYIEMGKKTVVRSAWKWLPISVEIMKKVETTDETVKTDISADMTEIPPIEASFTIDDEPEPQEENQQPETESESPLFER